MDDVARRAIEIIDSLPLGCWDVTRSGALQDEALDGLNALKAIAIGIQPIASGTLRSFKCVDSLYWKSKEGRFAKEMTAFCEVPPSLASIASTAWRMIGGEVSPEQASAIIAAARIEFARSHFNSLAVCAAFSGDTTFFRKDLSERARAELETMNWADADHIARNPWSPWGGADCVASDFNEWLWNSTYDSDKGDEFNNREPFNGTLTEPTTYNDAAQYALYAIAITWIDEAVFTPPHALQLLAETAVAFDRAGSRSGWNMHEEYMKGEAAQGRPQTVTDLARHAANVRHAQGRANAKALRDAYLAGSYTSKDSAAEELCRLYGFGFRAARDHLKGL